MPILSRTEDIIGCRAECRFMFHMDCSVAKNDKIVKNWIFVTNTVVLIAI